MTAKPIELPSLSARITESNGIEKSTGDCFTPIPMKISVRVEKRINTRVAIKGESSVS